MADAGEKKLLNAMLDEDLPEELIEKMAEDVSAALIEDLTETFPELGLKSRQMSEVIEDFRSQKLEDVESENHFGTKIDYIEEYLLSVAGVETTNDLTNEDVEVYSNWRRYNSLDREKPLSNATLQDDIYLFKEFVEYLISHRSAPARFVTVIEIPETEPGEGVDKKKLDPGLAETILSYLSKFHYASVDHVTMEILCDSGPRKSGTHTLDVEDFDPTGDFGTLQYEHSDETPLKNGGDSDREIKCYGVTAEVIQDYICETRPDATDEHGRRPLLTKGNGRMSKSMVQKIAYMWTRPCKVGLDCPHNREVSECKAAQKNNLAFSCPSSRAPHHIRTGITTTKRMADVPPESVKIRCDVNKKHKTNITISQKMRTLARKRVKSLKTQTKRTNLDTRPIDNVLDSGSFLNTDSPNPANDIYHS